MECQVCKKDFNEKTGRRPKKFCSDECKVIFWNKQKVIVKNLNKATNSVKDTQKKAAENESISTKEEIEFATNLSLSSAFEIEKVNKVAEYQAEIDRLDTLPKSTLTNQRKNFLLKQIKTILK